MSEIDGRALRAALAPYQRPATPRSLWELAATLLPLAAFSAGLYVCVARHWWWGLALAVPAGVFLVRLFMIQHDCGHHAFFRHPAANTWVGRLIGVLTMTPYDYWRRTHAIHHSNSGNLDRRGLGAVELMTVDEYRALPRLKRALYRFYRHPLVILGLGPSYLFILQHRLPIGVMKHGWAWKSVLGNNLGLAVIATALIALGGPLPYLITHALVVMIAATIGVWLFYVQHQFEHTHWAREDRWDATHAAVAGSSHLDLPAPFAWLTAHIGAHHVHHASSRIPFYRLPQVVKHEPVFAAARKIGLLESVTALRLSLWDEASQRLISFREARRRATVSA